MRILIENTSIYTATHDRRFITKGYMYIDKNTIMAVSDGLPPPELEFADYIINGRISVVVPGFSVGLGNILDYIFRFKDFANRKREILSTLGISDLTTLSSVVLASLALHGATSVTTIVSPVDHKVLSGLALAASECWIRLRLVIPVDNIDKHTVEDIIKSVTKSLKDPEALNKRIVTFGLYIERNIDKDLLELAKSINAKVFVDSSIANDIALRSSAGDFITLVKLGSREQDYSTLSRVVAVDVTLWRPGIGLAPLTPMDLNPRVLISTINRYVTNPREVIDTLCHYNPLNLDIGMDAIEVGKTADIVLLNFSEPPTGPIPMSEESFLEEIAMANYSVETMIVAGELTIDQGVTLNIGEKHIRKAQVIIESLSKKHQPIAV